MRHDPGHTDPRHRHGKSAGRSAASVRLHPADSLVALAIARGRVVLTALMDAADGQRPDAAQQFVSPLVAAGVEVTVLVTYGDTLGEHTGVLEHARGALADAMAVAGRPVEVLDTVEVALR